MTLSPAGLAPWTHSDRLTSLRGVHLVGSELSIRHCPKISFHLDLSLKKAAETIKLIEEVTSDKRQQPDSEAEPGDEDSVEPSSGEQA